MEGGATRSMAASSPRDSSPRLLTAVRADSWDAVISPGASWRRRRESRSTASRNWLPRVGAVVAAIRGSVASGRGRAVSGGGCRPRRFPGSMERCRCARTADTSRAVPTTPVRSLVSAFSTWRRRHRGAVLTTARAIERDIIDASFEVGSLKRPDVEDEPDEPAEDVAHLLDEADAIVTAAGPEILAEVEAERSGRRWWQIWKRKDDGGFHLSNR